MNNLYVNEGSYTQKVLDEVTTENKLHTNFLTEYLNISNLSKYNKISEELIINQSSKKLSYLTHNYFRYYGKFPPPVATKLIKNYTSESSDLIVDPMVGSGTTLVEAVIAKKNAIGIDVNPLSCLISKVKTTVIEPKELEESLIRFNDLYHSEEKNNTKDDLENYIPKMSNINHWFFEQTQLELALIKKIINSEQFTNDTDVRDFFKLGFASIIRKISRAGSATGRIFLDKNATPMNCFEILNKKLSEMITSMNELKKFHPYIKVLNEDATSLSLDENIADLVICHPPYFNLYRFSSVLTFEMHWLDYEYKKIQKKEVKESFKIGKPERLILYVDDMEKVLLEIFRILKPGKNCGLMIGDAVIHEQRITTTSEVIDRALKIGFSVKKIFVRRPKYTEATYATALRRNKEKLGIQLNDFIVVLQKT